MKAGLPRGEGFAGFALLAAHFLAASPAAAEPYFKTETMLAMCEAAGEAAGEAASDAPASRAKTNLCAFYLAGVSDALVTGALAERFSGDSAPRSTLCYPDPMALDALADVFKAFAKAAPERHGESAALVATAALRARYPCGAHAAAGAKPDVTFFSAADLLVRCNNGDRLSGLYCLYYVVGVADRATSDPRSKAICYPAGMPDDQPQRTFVEFMRDHTEVRDKNAAVVASAALHQAFPCR